ncbi:MarR family protein [Halorientalis persicus]|uniref:MarR family protein n=1 Tax=Halorientalis persicus TaxID=1367881 RepID=A0A1H8PCM1_9EURY|nr:helix-turn-helix domain-containing protein [Halorientalis persicus]SEO39685.1 MarR family protein [Halorientalis persicus]
MSESSQTHPAAETDTKAARLENPSGVLHLLQHESVPILIDAILTLPPGREFTKTELADHAGVTRQTVSKYIDLLVETEIVEEVANSSPRRYRVAKSDVVQELFELNSALNAAGE